MRYLLSYSIRSRIWIDAPKKRFFVPFSTFMSLLFYGTGFPIREISLSKNATSLRCYRTDQLVGRNFLGCPFLLYLEPKVKHWHISRDSLSPRRRNVSSSFYWVTRRKFLWVKPYLKAFTSFFSSTNFAVQRSTDWPSPNNQFNAGVGTARGNF